MLVLHHLAFGSHQAQRRPQPPRQQQHSAMPLGAFASAAAAASAGGSGLLRMVGSVTGESDADPGGGPELEGALPSVNLGTVAGRKRGGQWRLTPCRRIHQRRRLKANST